MRFACPIFQNSHGPSSPPSVASWRDFSVAAALALSAGSSPAITLNFPGAAIERIAVLSTTRAEDTLRLTLREPAAGPPLVHALGSRILVDFPGVTGLPRRKESFASGMIESLMLISTDERTRLILTLRKSARPRLELKGAEVVLGLTDDDAPPMAISPASSPPPAGPAGEKAEGLQGQGPAQMLLLELSVNDQPLPDIVLAERRPDGRLVLPLAAWKAARLRPHGEALPLPDGETGYALDALPGLRYTMDLRQLKLALTVPAEAFEATGMALAGRGDIPPNAAPPGLYLNYDMFAIRGEAGTNSHGGLVETVAFSRWGSFMTGALVRGNEGENRSVRTETFWRQDFPDRMASLTIGDTLGSGGAGSRPVRFGGIRWGRDFSLAPGYITHPMPTLAGSAALPSSVDLLVNNQRVIAGRQMAAGPFTLSNIPVVNGEGELTLVVRDLRGVDTLVTQKYYGAPRLLAPGLADFSFEAGALRLNYGSESADYGDRFAASTYRRGLTSALTAEGRVELQPTRRAAGLELSGLLGTVALARVGAAWSRSEDTDSSATISGGRYLLGLERSSRRGSWALNWDYFGERFRQFAAASTEPRPRTRFTAGGGLPLGHGMSLGISYARQTTWDGDDFSLAALNFSWALTSNLHLSAYVSKQLAPNKSWSGGLSLTLPLQPQTVLSSQGIRDTTGRRTMSAQASRSAPAGPGWGWRVKTSDSPGQTAQGGVTLNTNQAQFSAESNAGQGTNAVRLGASGSLGWLQGVPFASRHIGQGAFAVVRVGDFEGVPVMRSHQAAALTERNGAAVVPGLLPYQKNLLTIDAALLPMSAEISQVQSTVTPYARSGVFVDIPVRRARNALVILRQADGRPVPSGARVRLTPAGHEFSVARRGEVYLSDLQNENQLAVAWEGNSCTLPFRLTGSEGEEPRIGPLTCADGP